MYYTYMKHEHMCYTNSVASKNSTCPVQAGTSPFKAYTTLFNMSKNDSYKGISDMLSQWPMQITKSQQKQFTY